jgi:hypothetical protein
VQWLAAFTLCCMQMRLAAVMPLINAHPQLLSMPCWPRAGMLESRLQGRGLWCSHSIGGPATPPEPGGGPASTSNTHALPEGVPRYQGPPAPIDLASLLGDLTISGGTPHLEEDGWGGAGGAAAASGPAASKAQLTPREQDQLEVLQGIARDMDAFHVAAYLHVVISPSCVGAMARTCMVMPSVTNDGPVSAHHQRADGYCCLVRPFCVCHTPPPCILHS